MSKVCVIGAAGGIGQPLSLLLRKNSLVSHLALYDIASTKGVVADLKGCQYSSKVEGFTGKDELSAALLGADVVIVVAGRTMQGNERREDLFHFNAGIIMDLCRKMIDACPKAFLAIVTNPVNSLVPLAVETFKNEKVKDAEKRVFGVTTLDLTRASVFAGELFEQVAVEKIFIPVIGGHDGVTILPLLSKSTPHRESWSLKEMKRFIQLVQQAGPNVLKQKDGKGTATLSTADATAKFIHSLCLAKQGTKVEEYTYVHTNICPECEFFSSKVTIDRQGVASVADFNPLAIYEKSVLAECIATLKESIVNGKSYANKFKKIKTGSRSASM